MLEGQEVPLPDRGARLVSHHAAARHRDPPGRLAFHGRPVHLYPAHRDLHHGGLGDERSCGRQTLGKGRPGRHGWRRHGRADDPDLGPGGALEGQHPAFRVCGQGKSGKRAGPQQPRLRLPGRGAHEGGHRPVPRIHSHQAVLPESLCQPCPGHGPGGTARHRHRLFPAHHHELAPVRRRPRHAGRHPEKTGQAERGNHEIPGVAADRGISPRSM